MKRSYLFALSLFIACPHAPEIKATPRDFGALNALLLQGEPQREEAQRQIKDEQDYSHVISLLAQFEAPGEPAALAWSAHHLLLNLGEPALGSLQKSNADGPMERFTAERLRRRLGLVTPPTTAFSEIFCHPETRGAVMLRYEAGREEAEGRISFQVDESGHANLFIKHTIKAPFHRSFLLSPIELGFLFDRVCASFFWEDFPRREQGSPSEDAVTFSVSVTPEGQSALRQDTTVWGDEWRMGSTERLAKMLDATVARGKQTSLLLP